MAQPQSLEDAAKLRYRRLRLKPGMDPQAYPACLRCPNPRPLIIGQARPAAATSAPRLRCFLSPPRPWSACPLSLREERESSTSPEATGIGQEWQFRHAVMPRSTRPSATRDLISGDVAPSVSAIKELKFSAGDISRHRRFLRITSLTRKRSFCRGRAGGITGGGNPSAASSLMCALFRAPFAPLEDMIA